MLPTLPSLTLTFAADGFAPRCLAAIALGDIVAMLFDVAHDTIPGNALAKAAEQAFECLAGSFFNFRHPFLSSLYGIVWHLSFDSSSLALAKTDLVVAPHNQL
jgi:hypothetical protein